MSFKTYDKKVQLKKLGSRLKEIRKRLGFTNAHDFAYSKNINASQYGKWESGQNITFSNLLKLLNLYEITLTEFFSEGFDDEYTH